LVEEALVPGPEIADRGWPCNLGGASHSCGHFLRSYGAGLSCVRSCRNPIISPFLPIHGAFRRCARCAAGGWRVCTVGMIEHSPICRGRGVASRSRCAHGGSGAHHRLRSQCLCKAPPRRRSTACATNRSPRRDPASYRPRVGWCGRSAAGPPSCPAGEQRHVASVGPASYRQRWAASAADHRHRLGVEAWATLRHRRDYNGLSGSPHLSSTSDLRLLCRSPFIAPWAMYCFLRVSGYAGRLVSN
jgi:hypothetical protein